MPKEKPASLPEELGYLQPFVNRLAKLPADQLNEDVDPSRLDDALRKRIDGLDPEAATLKVEADLAQLKDWLKNHRQHPAHWISGYLSSADLVEALVTPPEPVDPGPKITFDLPAGWRLVRTIPFRMDFKKGKVLGSITALDEAAFAHLRLSRGKTSPQIAVPGFDTSHIKLTRELINVAFGQCHGTKYIGRMAAPAAWKQVDYLLTIPGGHVFIWLGTMTGADFDEVSVEASLHTVSLSPST